MRLFTTALGAATLLACTDGQTECDAMAMASVSISVTDLDGNPFSPTSLTYTVDGGEERDAECWNDDCSEAVAGWEVAGEFTITATLSEELENDPCCWYSDQVIETLVIEQGECHVVGQVITLALDTESLICADDSECG